MQTMTASSKPIYNGDAPLTAASPTIGNTISDIELTLMQALETLEAVECRLRSIPKNAECDPKKDRDQPAILDHLGRINQLSSKVAQSANSIANVVG